VVAKVVGGVGRRRSRRTVEGADNAVHNIVHIGEVAPNLALSKTGIGSPAMIAVVNMNNAMSG